MNYCLFKMHFKSALHIGSDSGVTSLISSEMQIHSDTLFSSLCIEALQADGQNELDRLYSYVKDGKLCFSDAFPFSGDELYIPKPIISVQSKSVSRDSDDVKKIKKLVYLPITEFEEYLAYLKGDELKGFKGLAENKQFGVTNIRAMASIHGEDETEPFHVGIFEFLQDCGLYIIVAYEADEQFELMKKLLTLLSLSGIGGKRTAGMGSFELEDEIFLDSPFTEAQEYLNKFLTLEKTTWSMTLNVSLPVDEELDEVIKESYFKLTRRGGFVQSQSYAENPIKKQVIHLISAGSCVKKRFKGDIFDVSINGTHPVFRMAKPLFMGVDI